MDTIDNKIENLENENLESKKPEESNFSWCGYTWKAAQENGRLIHPDSPWYWYSLDTIRICSDNVLELYIKYNPKEIKHWNGKTYHPTIEVPTMRTIETFGYGTFKADIMLPTGTNLWPSFWTTGSGNWPPELDIMEAWSEDDKYFKWFIAQPPYFSPSWRTTTNVHYRNKDLEHKSVGSRNISWFKQRNNPCIEYIEYKCEWLPNSITFYANGREVRKITGDVCKDLIVNLKDLNKGYKMNVLFDVWCEDPEKCNVEMYTPMRIKNFEYEPYTIYYRP